MALVMETWSEQPEEPIPAKDEKKATSKKKTK